MWRGRSADLRLTSVGSIQAASAADDADMVADVFAENGSLLMRDDQLTSRAEIRAYLAAGLAGPFQGARVTGRPLDVQFLATTPRSWSPRAASCYPATATCCRSASPNRFCQVRTQGDDPGRPGAYRWRCPARDQE